MGKALVLAPVLALALVLALAHSSHLSSPPLHLEYPLHLHPPPPPHRRGREDRGHIEVDLFRRMDEMVAGGDGGGVEG